MFSKSYRIGSVYDVPLRISRLWIVIFTIATYTLSRPAALEEYTKQVSPISPIEFTAPLFTSNLEYVLFGAVVVLGMYASVILHELGHVYGGRINGIDVVSVTLWVLGGVAQLAGEPTDARQEFELTIAGPLVSLFLALVGAGFAYLTIPLGYQHVVLFFILFTVVNAGMLLLNLIPAFPLDGGRLLRSVLTAVFNFEQGTSYATRVGKLIAITVFIGSVFHVHAMGVLLSGFVFFSARSENQRVQELVAAETPDNPLEKIDTNGSTFVLETPVTAMPIEQITSLIGTNGGKIGITITQTTDYIVVPEGEGDMYETIAANYDAEIIDASTFDSHVEALLTDSKPTGNSEETSDQSPTPTVN